VFNKGRVLRRSSQKSITTRFQKDINISDINDRRFTCALKSQVKNKIDKYIHPRLTMYASVMFTLAPHFNNEEREIVEINYC